MTKEEAIFCEKSYIGETNCTDCKYYGTDTCQSRVSHKMAIKALEQQPSEDCVSRQAVLAIANDSCLDLDSYEDAKEFCDEIKDLLPVTPTHGTCKDCCHRDPEDKKCDCGHDIIWQLPREDDWYCADFEKRGNKNDI